MSHLKLKDISKKYPNGFVAVKDLSLDIFDNEFIVFVGPSDCGKTTILRMIAGLEKISNGELYIDNEIMNNVSPKDRDVAIIFKNYILYPYMTVYDNMAFGLKLKKLPEEEIDKCVRATAEILDIVDLLDKEPKDLSIEQQQCVIMARAAVRNPKVLLLDEPLVDIDLKIKLEVIKQISNLHKKFKTTVVYTTQDSMEALELGTKIVVLKDGIIQQIGTPEDISNKPINSFVADYMSCSPMNFINADVVEIDNNIFLQFGNNKIKLSEMYSKILIDKKYIGKSVIFGIKSENIHDDDAFIQKCPHNVIDATVESLENLNGNIDICLSISEQNIISHFNSKLPREIGETIKIAFNFDEIYLFDKSTQMSIIN